MQTLWDMGAAHKREPTINLGLLRHNPVQDFSRTSLEPNRNVVMLSCFGASCQGFDLPEIAAALSDNALSEARITILGPQQPVPGKSSDRGLIWKRRSPPRRDSA